MFVGDQPLIMKILLAILQSLLFFVVFAAGSFWAPFKIAHIIAYSPRGSRVFYWDGIILMLVVFAVILLIEVLRKRLRTAAPWTVAALAVATGIGLYCKLGFLTIGTW
jgi:hypothetical protein